MLFSATSINAQTKYIDIGGYTIQAAGFQSLASVTDINTACYPSAPNPGTANAANVMTQQATPIVIGTTAPYQLTYINDTDTAGRLYSNVTGKLPIQAVLQHLL